MRMQPCAPDPHTRPLASQRPATRLGRSQLAARAAEAPGSAARPLSHVAELSSAYKGVLLDQFGVLHDGQRAYPAAVEAVAQLAAGGRKILILSNSSRRSSNTLPKLERLGFDVACFAGAVTSGELTFRSLRDRPGAWWQALGTRCLHLTWGARGAVSLDGLELEVVTDPQAADFVLAHGTEVLGTGDDSEPVPTTMDGFRQLLAAAAARRLPLIVANPDVVTVSGDSLVPMPGTFARWYKEMGGEVVLMGKPDPVVYTFAMELLGLPAGEVVAVGDSLEHDVAGAAAAGVNTLFIAGGIHAQELGVGPGSPSVDAGALARLCASHGASPRYVIPYLQ